MILWLRLNQTDLNCRFLGSSASLLVSRCREPYEWDFSRCNLARSIHKKKRCVTLSPPTAMDMDAKVGKEWRATASPFPSGLVNTACRCTLCSAPRRELTHARYSKVEFRSSQLPRWPQSTARHQPRAAGADGGGVRCHSWSNRRAGSDSNCLRS